MDKYQIIEEHLDKEVARLKTENENLDPNEIPRAIFFRLGKILLELQYIASHMPTDPVSIQEVD